MRNNSFHYWTLTEMIIPRFLGTGRLLIKYSNDYKIKNKFRDYF